MRINELITHLREASALVGNTNVVIDFEGFKDIYLEIVQLNKPEELKLKKLIVIRPLEKKEETKDDLKTIEWIPITGICPRVISDDKVVSYVKGDSIEEDVYRTHLISTAPEMLNALKIVKKTS